MSMLPILRELFYQSEQTDRSCGMLIISPENRRYLTGFSSGDGFLAVCADDALFFTDSRYIEAAEQTVTICPCVEQQDIFTQLNDFYRAHAVTSVEIESGRLTVKQFENLKKHSDGVTVEATGRLDDCIDAMRCVKSEAEIASVVRAQRIAEEAFSYMLEQIKPGMTEKQLALALDHRMLSNGAEALSFETIAVSGANTSKPHGVPSDKKIEKGDFITMDFGAVCNGYHSDMTRTVAVGSVSEKQRRVYNTVLLAKNTAEQKICAGLAAKDADKAARDVIEQAGFGQFFRHGTGHGVGVEIHELPNLSPKSTYTLQCGNLVTVEPGIYIPSEFGVRVEDMVLVEKDGCRRLTAAPEELIVL